MDYKKLSQITDGNHIQYQPTFEEEREELEALKRNTQDLIEFYRSRGDTERTRFLYEDIEEIDKELEELESRRSEYNSRVGYDW